MKVERQWQKAEARAAEVTAPLLAEGETSELVLLGNTRMRLLWAALAIFPVVFLLELNGYGGWNPLVLGFSFGAYVAAFVRGHLVVLTNRRVMVIRYKRLSTKRVDFVDVIEPTFLREVNWRPRLVNGSLTLVTDTRRYEIDTTSAFTERAEEFVKRLRWGAGAEAEGIN